MKFKLERLIVITIVMIAMLVSPQIVRAEDNIKLWVDGNYVSSDISPYIEDDRTLVPIRVIAEALAYDVDWDNLERKITVSKNEDNIIMKVGSKQAIHNGEYTDLYKEPTITNSRAFLPIRDVAERLGENVDWDMANKTVIVGDNYKPYEGITKQFISKSAMHIPENYSKEYIRFNPGQIIEVLGDIEGPTLTAIKGSKRYSIPSERLMPISMSTTTLTKVDSVYDMSLAKQHLEGELPRVGSESLYYTLSVLGAYKNDEVYFKHIVDEYTVKGKTNNDKILEIVKHLEKYDLKYDFDENVELNQLETIPKGYSKCLGITRVGKALLDKARVPYRAITTQSIDYISESRVPKNGGHILLQVRNNSDEWAKLDLTELILDKSSNSINRSEQIKAELISPSNLFPKMLPSKIKTINYLIAPEILNNEILGESMDLFIVK